MTKPLKHATLEQAQQQLIANAFVYHNPCSCCNKQCSTPTQDIWLKRISEFGSVEAMYANYKCRNCRKKATAKAVQPMQVQMAKEPLPRMIATAPMMKAKAERPMIQIKPEVQPRKPGDFLEPKPGEMAFSIWENGIYKGTAWHKTGEKIS